MNDKQPVSVGSKRLSESIGPWRADADADLPSDEEWLEAWDSLREWLGRHYQVRWSPESKRHCVVLDEYVSPERTLRVNVLVPDILTAHFLGLVQAWVKSAWREWRVVIDTDYTDENAIVVYPDCIRINPEAEKDVEAFLQRIRPRIEPAQAAARRRIGME